MNELRKNAMDERLNNAQTIALAEIAHYLNQIYCEGLGEEVKPGGGGAEDYAIMKSITDGIRFCEENQQASPKQMHNNWMAHKIKEGWVLGEEKDSKKKTHPSLRPYDELPKSERAKDKLFKELVLGAKHLIGITLEGEKNV